MADLPGFYAFVSLAGAAADCPEIHALQQDGSGWIRLQVEREAGIPANCHEIHTSQKDERVELPRNHNLKSKCEDVMLWIFSGFSLPESTISALTLEGSAFIPEGRLEKPLQIHSSSPWYSYRTPTRCTGGVSLMPERLQY